MGYNVHKYQSVLGTIKRGLFMEVDSFWLQTTLWYIHMYSGCLQYMDTCMPHLFYCEQMIVYETHSGLLLAPG